MAIPHGLYRKKLFACFAWDMRRGSTGFPAMIKGLDGMEVIHNTAGFAFVSLAKPPC